MANKNGKTYGLTVLSPIINDPVLNPSHATQIREYLAEMPNGMASPFAQVPTTFLARLTVIDDVTYEGHSAQLENLKSQYLLFTSNFYGNLDDYLNLLLEKMSDDVEAIWSHCVGYPGRRKPDAFRDYIKRCQLTTTFFFADVNHKSLVDTLKALQVQAELARFIEEHQGQPAEELQRRFQDFMGRVRNIRQGPGPQPGSLVYGS